MRSPSNSVRKGSIAELTHDGAVPVALSLEYEDGGSNKSVALGTVAATVQDFELPARSSFMADAGVEFAPFFRWAPTPAATQPAAVKDIYAQLASYRINRLVACDGVLPIAPPSLTLAADGAVRLETAAMDEMVSYVLSLGFEAFALPEVAGCGPVLSTPHAATPTDTWTFHNKSYQQDSDAFSISRAVRPLTSRYHHCRIFAKSESSASGGGGATLSPAFVSMFKQVYGALVAHLKSRGWDKHARAVFLDEPSVSGFTGEAVNAVNGLWKEVGLRVMQTEFSSHDTGVDSWNVKVGLTML